MITTNMVRFVRLVTSIPKRAIRVWRKHLAALGDTRFDHDGNLKSKSALDPAIDSRIVAAEGNGSSRAILCCYERRNQGSGVGFERTKWRAVFESRMLIMIEECNR